MNNNYLPPVHANEAAERALLALKKSQDNELFAVASLLAQAVAELLDAAQRGERSFWNAANFARTAMRKWEELRGGDEGAANERNE